METVMVVMLGIGIWIGFLAGRLWTERSRARADMQAVWGGRKRYRGTRPF